jgi:hypothetical protein
MKSELSFARPPFSIPHLYSSLITDLDNRSLRNVTLPEIDALVEYLDSYRPSLKADIQNLTSLLSPLIEDRCLPDQRLKLEMLTESQITSGEHAARSLKELFEFSDYYSYFLTEAARSDLSDPVTEASPYPLASFEEKADGSTALPGPHTLEQDDPGMTYTNFLFLSSPVYAQGIDWLREDFSFNEYLE